MLVLSLIVSYTPAGKGVAPVGTDSESPGYTSRGKYVGNYWPTTGWKTCVPEAVGMDSKKQSTAAAPRFNTEGILVIKNGYIVSEAYFGTFQQDTEHISHSMAKSFTSALIGIATDIGLIANIDEKVCQYYEQWNCNNEKNPRSRITIRHAMTVTTGLKWHEDWTKWDFSTNDALKMGASGFFMEYMSERDDLHEPGQKFYYSTGDPMLLSRVIQEATGMTAFDFARKNLFDPLNISKVRWDKDLDGYTATAWGLHTTVRSFAKFGYLFLNQGRWENRQIVFRQWVAQSTRTDPSVNMWNAYGYLWHVNLPVRLRDWSSKIPPDGYMAEDVLGQNIFIIPSKNLVIVKVADQKASHLDLVKFLTMVLDAEKS